MRLNDPALGVPVDRNPPLGARPNIAAAGRGSDVAAAGVAAGWTALDPPPRLPLVGPYSS